MVATNNENGEYRVQLATGRAPGSSGGRRGPPPRAVRRAANVTDHDVTDLLIQLETGLYVRGHVDPGWARVSVSSSAPTTSSLHAIAV
jgi:hypothetical protein